ncbi:MAG: hypothetical protein ACYC8T_01055 [Myxococcaceae bacterium]
MKSTATFCTDRVVVRGVVVAAIDDTFKGGQGDYISQFWVVDPANPGEGIWVDKYFTDLPGPYNPVVGDVLDIDGYFGMRSKFDDRVGYRFSLKSQFACAGNPTGKLSITKTGTTSAPVDNVVAAGFGNADGGWVKANPERAGTRVHIPGPLVITDPNPTAFKRIFGSSLYYGFEVSNGILVNNSKTYGTSPTDGGRPRCDWRAFALDGGAVSFPNGISGVWESYTHAACYDGGTSSSCKKDAGVVPGTTANYTFVLYPQDCETDFAGADAGL